MHLLLVDIERLYRCLADLERVRILALLEGGALCVCHLQAVLDMGQVRTSKHLAILRRAELVSGEREGNWMIYRLASTVPPLVAHNLALLRGQQGGAVAEQLRADEERREALLRSLNCGPVPLLRRLESPAGRPTACG